MALVQENYLLVFKRQTTTIFNLWSCYDSSLHCLVKPGAWGEGKLVKKPAIQGLWTVQAQQVLQTVSCTQPKNRDAESGGTGTIYDLFATTEWKLYLFFSMSFKGTQENGNNCTQSALNDSLIALF